MNRRAEVPCVGYIDLVFFDGLMNEAVCLGGAGFVSASEDEMAWENVPAFSGYSSFQADRKDANGDIIEEKSVSAETCEALMGQPISDLISMGRAKRKAELAGYTLEGKV
ncbi:hypothetical protein PAQ31011_05149 [Pandoraea aquatica]|uniref:Uncharacterized protein n=1 Tax=Pandoraea aquatica TaxID=2508290 RepID=A0A5E4Z7U1_9BURK|nr:hypothetical protein PAQ31011_05149 [Pandoraea aquatica]